MFVVNIKKKQRSFDGLPARQLYDLMIRIMMVYPLGWNKLFKLLHFTESAKQRYDYAPRAGEREGGQPIPGSYTAKKLRLYKHQLALVFTGRGRDEALANDFATAGRRHGGQLWARATLPRVFNLRNPRGRTNPAKEITTVLKSEQAVLNQLAQQKTDAEFRRHSGYAG